MKLNNIELTFDNFSKEMEKLYKEKHCYHYRRRLW